MKKFVCDVVISKPDLNEKKEEAWVYSYEKHVKVDAETVEEARESAEQKVREDEKIPDGWRIDVFDLDEY
ncbi:hypothetical protein IC620_16565 [Hazenella sp. IB182357]|uniref:Uncharacterized protein n=1 Tax=Polycladospora coralii TaxID=2771432 RepID=A0A926NCB0_9BACL|nr:hypothetical protein [Polycladospora coralii]MBD1373957.1 hypothetical protein [Polycladospora coralii]